jgi:uncharacterized membrane protein
MVPGIAWVAEKRPWPALRWLAAAVTVALFGRIVWDPRIVDAGAILFTVLLIVLEVRHYLTGDPYLTLRPLAETALDVSLLLAMVIGLERIRLKSGSIVHDWGARLLAAAVFIMISTSALPRIPCSPARMSAARSSI